MSDLTGKVALVTGGSRGIGRAVVVALAKAGCDVAVNYRQAADEAEAVAAEVRALRQKSIVVQADVADASQVKMMVAETEGALGGIDILINNAGAFVKKPLEEISLEDWNWTIATNLTSAFLVTQAVVGGMRARKWGRIVMLSSIAAETGGVIGPHYAASKAGMHGLAHSYAALLAKEGVTCNVVAPALIETEMVRSNPAAKPDLIPVGRFGQVEEVAEAVMMLVGNAYVTGQTVNVNGGWYMS